MPSAIFVPVFKLILPSYSSYRELSSCDFPVQPAAELAVDWQPEPVPSPGQVLVLELMPDYWLSEPYPHCVQRESHNPY
jgi:hypothetical protein